MKAELPKPVRKYDGIIIAIMTAAILGLAAWVLKAEARMSVMENSALLDRQALQDSMSRLERRIVRLDDKVDQLLMLRRE